MVLVTDKRLRMLFTKGLSSQTWIVIKFNVLSKNCYKHKKC